MATSKPGKSQAAPTQPTTPALAPPAQQVWLAGLGAMAKAQEQGSKAIEALLSDGLAFQRKSQAEAQQRLQEATERLGHLASDFGQTASGRVDKLEHLFEDRVAKALHRLGVPSLQDMQVLSERVARLEAWVQSQSPQTLTGTKSTKSGAQSSASRQRPSTPPADKSGSGLTSQTSSPARSARKPPAKTARKSVLHPK